MAACNPLSFCSAAPHLNPLTTPGSQRSISCGGSRCSPGFSRGSTLKSLQFVTESEYPTGPNSAAASKINPRKEGNLHSLVSGLSASCNAFGAIQPYDLYEEVGLPLSGGTSWLLINPRKEGNLHSLVSGLSASCNAFGAIQPYDLYEEVGLPLSGGTSWLLQPSRPKSTAVKDNLVFFPNNWEAWSALLDSAFGISTDVFSPKQNSGDHSMAKGDGDVRRPPLFEDWLAIASLCGMEPLYAADNGIVCVILHSNHQSSALARASPVFYPQSRVMRGSLIGSGYASCGVISLHSNHRNSTVNTIFYTPPKTMPSSSLGCPCWGLKPSPTVSVVGIDPRNAKAGRACSVVRATPTAGGGGVTPKNNIFAVISAIARFLPAFWKLVDDKLNISTSEQVLKACYFLVIVNQNPSSQLCTILHVLAMVTFIVLAMGAVAILVHVCYKRRCSQVSDSVPDRRGDGNAHSANNVYNDFQNGSIKTETFINNYHDATGRTATY